MIPITPSPTPIPFDLADEAPKTHADAVSVAVNTANLIADLGGSVDFSDEDLERAAKLIKGEAKSATPKHVSSPAEAAAAAHLVRRFDFQAFADAVQARHYITNKLLALSDCGDAKIELKALELLGKHSDIGLFSERSEITVTHKTSSDLEASIRERIKRLLHSDVVDVHPPMISMLDEDAPDAPDGADSA